MPRYYVYSLAYPDGTIFYIGKGSGDRINAHEREAKAGKTRNQAKIEVIRQIWASGDEVLKTFLAYFEDEEEAYLYENDLISTIPNLVNIPQYERPQAMSGKRGPRGPFLRFQREKAQELLALWESTKPVYKPRKVYIPRKAKKKR